MIDARLELNQKLCDILGSRNVYYDPPESIKIKYPAIVYTINGIDDTYSAEGKYLQSVSYLVTVIDKNADSQTAEKISKELGFKYYRHYVSDNLHHYVFTYSADLRYSH